MTSSAPPSWATFCADLSTEKSAAEKRSDWAIYLLYRRPGVWVAYRAALLNIRPTQITVLALLVALSLPVQALVLPVWLAGLFVCLSGMMFQVLDCADGTLARATGQTGQRGGDMDFLTDMAQWGLLYAAIGILADGTFGTGFFWTSIAITAAWARLLARVIRDRLGKAPNTADEDAAPPGPVMTNPALLLAGISGLLPFLALSGPYLGWAVLFLLIYALLDISEGLLPLWHSD